MFENPYHWRQLRAWGLTPETAFTCAFMSVPYRACCQLNKPLHILHLHRFCYRAGIRAACR